MISTRPLALPFTYHKPLYAHSVNNTTAQPLANLAPKRDLWLLAALLPTLMLVLSQFVQSVHAADAPKHTNMHAPAAAASTQHSVALSTPVATTQAQFSEPYKVGWQGELKRVHNGDASAQVPLAAFANQPHLYAMGAVAENDGEITAAKGQFYTSQVRNGEVVTTQDLSNSASFLVWSQVEKWRDPVLLERSVNNMIELQEQVERLATAAGIDTSKPFPFKLTGQFEQLDYHILGEVAEAPAHGAHTSDHTNQNQVGADHAPSLKKVAKQEQAEVLGFFSKAHQGVFTHHDSFLHLHVLNQDGSTGHIDELIANGAIKVSFPEA